MIDTYTNTDQLVPPRSDDIVGDCVCNGGVYDMMSLLMMVAILIRMMMAPPMGMVAMTGSAERMMRRHVQSA